MNPDTNPMLADETGKFSSARIAFWLVLIVTLLLVIGDSMGMLQVAQAAYSLLSTILIALASWAGGPRIAQYLAPQLGAVAMAIGQARPLTRTIDNPDVKP